MNPPGCGCWADIWEGCECVYCFGQVCLHTVWHGVPFVVSDGPLGVRSGRIWNRFARHELVSFQSLPALQISTEVVHSGLQPLSPAARGHEATPV